MIQQPRLAAAAPEAARRQAFAELYRAQFDRIYAYLRYRVGDEVVAEDLAAEVFARAWAHLRRLDDRDGAIAWLFTTAHHLLIDHHRTQPQQEPLSLDDMAQDLPSESQWPETQVLAAERVALAARCLATLSEREREVVGLRFVAGLQNREIAPVLGLSEGNVAKIIHRALIRVRNRLHEDGSDG